MKRTERIVRVSLFGEQRFKIMSLLGDGREMTGREINHADPSLPSGTIYTTLRRLERAKLVIHRKVHDSGRPGPGPRYYKATVRGLKLAAMMHEITALLNEADSE